MATVACYLADKSALARMHRPDVAATLMPLFDDGRLGMCSVVKMEMLYSARSLKELDSITATYGELEWLPMHDGVEERALETQRALAERGKHRAVGVNDLLVAATAEMSRVTLLHYDADFDEIAAVTGQPTAWIVPRGSVN